MKTDRICKYCGDVLKNATALDIARHTRKCKKGRAPQVTKEPTDKFMKLLAEIHPDIIPKIRPMLWRDEIKSSFILTRNAEIYLYSKTELGVYVWNSGYWDRIRSIVKDPWRTDPPDTIYTGGIDIGLLPKLLNDGCFKKRPHLDGGWLAHKKKILGHDITPYTPDIFS